mmetsp:Transcript_117667/g.327631  ORF Transcript_117667/g.327631 Transcript_117667/m.327631 type:complete len:204 (-) Transcript_117667:76-687(-)
MQQRLALACSWVCRPHGPGPAARPMWCFLPHRVLHRCRGRAAGTREPQAAPCQPALGSSRPSRPGQAGRHPAHAGPGLALAHRRRRCRGLLRWRGLCRLLGVEPYRLHVQAMAAAPRSAPPWPTPPLRSLPAGRPWQARVGRLSRPGRWPGRRGRRHGHRRPGARPGLRLQRRPRPPRHGCLPEAGCGQGIGAQMVPKSLFLR